EGARSRRRAAAVPARALKVVSLTRSLDGIRPKSFHAPNARSGTPHGMSSADATGHRSLAIAVLSGLTPSAGPDRFLCQGGGRMGAYGDDVLPGHDGEARRRQLAMGFLGPLADDHRCGADGTRFARPGGSDVHHK